MAPNMIRRTVPRRAPLLGWLLTGAGQVSYARVPIMSDQLGT